MSAFEEWENQFGIKTRRTAWNAALDRVAKQLRDAGATLPAPPVTGTIEGSMLTGLCVALAVVEDTRAARDQS